MNTKYLQEMEYLYEQTIDVLSAECEGWYSEAQYDDGYKPEVDNIETEPFRAYFAGYYGSSDDGGAVQFCFDTNSATPVTLPTIEPTTDEAIYTIEGVRCPAGRVLSKGLYIKNGKKIVVK